MRLVSPTYINIKLYENILIYTNSSFIYNLVIYHNAREPKKITKTKTFFFKYMFKKKFKKRYYSLNQSMNSDVFNKTIKLIEKVILKHIKNGSIKSLHCVVFLMRLQLVTIFSMIFYLLQIPLRQFKH